MAGLRIGLISGEYPPMQGGVGAYTRILARTFAGLGHKVAVLTSTAAQEDDPRLMLRNTIQAWSLPSIRHVRDWARDERLDVVNLQYQTAAYGMSPWIHVLPEVMRSIPFVTTYHDLRFPYLFPKAGPLRDWSVMHLARASDGAIVTNHEDFERLKLLKHVALIPIGSNIDHTPATHSSDRDWRGQAGASGDDFLIAYFGFRNRSKGLDVLLDALATLRRDGVPARLLLLGGRAGASDPTNAAYAEELDRRVDTLGLSEAVTETGFIDDNAVSGYLRASDAVALPFLDGASFRRGTLMAAIQSGSVIVTTTPAVTVPEFIDGVNMLLVEPGSAAGLADALRTLYQSPELCQPLRQGAARLAGRFDWTRIAGDTIAFYERVIGV